MKSRNRSDQSKILTLRKYRAGEWIYSQGDPATETMIVKSGHVELVRKDGSAASRRIKVASQGQVFGELALVCDGRRRVSARAIDDTELLAINRSQLNARLEKADAFVCALFQILAERIRSMIDMGASSEESLTETFENFAKSLEESDDDQDDGDFEDLDAEFRVLR